jgi:small-conductance mechanosensitive channel
MFGLTLLQIYWRAIYRIQLAFNTRTAQYAATIGAGLGFVLFIALLYRLARPLKDRYDENGVEILLALLGTIGAILVSVFVIAVWRQTNRFLQTFGEFGFSPERGILLLVSFVVLAVTYTLTRITKRFITFGSGRVELTPHQRELVHHLVQIFLFLNAFAFIWFLWELSWGDILLGAGAIGIIVGFAARKTLSDVLAGFVLLFARPFEVGDWVSVGDREGIVTQITIYNTQIRTFNEEHVVIPNDGVTDSEVVNYSKTDRLRLVTRVGVDYETDMATAMSVATDAMDDCETVASNPNPDVILDSFSDSAIVLRLRYWITRPTIQQKLSAQNEVIRAVKDAFDEEDIKIPYPQRELMGREDTDGLRVSTDGDRQRGTGLEDEDVTRAVRQVSRADDERVEEAVERVSEIDDATIVEEPVEERYGGDGGPNQEDDDGADDDDSEDTEADGAHAEGGDDGAESDEPEEEEEKKRGEKKKGKGG